LETKPGDGEDVRIVSYLEREIKAATIRLSDEIDAVALQPVTSECHSTVAWAAKHLGRRQPKSDSRKTGGCQVCAIICRSGSIFYDDR